MNPAQNPHNLEPRPRGRVVFPLAWKHIESGDLTAASNAPHPLALALLDAADKIKDCLDPQAIIQQLERALREPDVDVASTGLGSQPRCLHGPLLQDFCQLGFNHPQLLKSLLLFQSGKSWSRDLILDADANLLEFAPVTPASEREYRVVNPRKIAVQGGYMSMDVYEAIKSERAYQEAKWPGHKHTTGEWLLIMCKCLDDARRVWVGGHGNDQALHEIRQVVAVGVAAMEQCGSPLRASASLRENQSSPIRL